VAVVGDMRRAGREFSNPYFKYCVKLMGAQWGLGVFIRAEGGVIEA